MNQRSSSLGGRAAALLLAPALLLGSGCGDSHTVTSTAVPASPEPGLLRNAPVPGTNAPGAPPSLADSALSTDATETLVRWNKAGLPAPPGGSPDDIAPDFWFPRIRDLHPLRVYSHRVNLVVVTNQTATGEEGYYVTVAYSSYMPNPMEPSSDGFQFDFPELAASKDGSSAPPSGPLRFRRKVPNVPTTEAPAR